MEQVSEGANPYYRSVSAKGCVWGMATPPQQRKRMLTSEVLTSPEGGGVVVPVSCRVAPSAVLRSVRGAAAQKPARRQKGLQDCSDLACRSREHGGQSVLSRGGMDEFADRRTLSRFS